MSQKKGLPESVLIDAEKFKNTLEQIKNKRGFFSKFYAWVFLPPDSISLSEKERNKLLPLLLPPKNDKEKNSSKENLPAKPRVSVSSEMHPSTNTQRKSLYSTIGLYSRSASNGDAQHDKPEANNKSAHQNSL